MPLIRPSAHAGASASRIPGSNMRQSVGSERIELSPSFGLGQSLSHSCVAVPLSSETGGQERCRCAIPAWRNSSHRAAPFAPGLAPTAYRFSNSWSSADKTVADEKAQDAAPRNVVSADADKRSKPLTTCVNGLHKVETRGVEPLTPALQRRCSPN